VDEVQNYKAILVTLNITGTITGLPSPNPGYPITIKAIGTGGYGTYSDTNAGTAGSYSMGVPYGWTGSLAAISAQYIVTALPPLFNNNVPMTSDQVQNYKAQLITFTIAAR